MSESLSDQGIRSPSFAESIFPRSLQKFGNYVRIYLSICQTYYSISFSVFSFNASNCPCSAIVYTTVAIAKANGINVYHYRNYLLEKMPNDSMSDEKLELFVPWNEAKKTEIERRVASLNQ